MSWLANAVLLGICCFLVANTANTVFAALLTPAPEELAPAAVTGPAADRSWTDRTVILERNLFDSATVAPPPPLVEPEPENLQATNLPLDLLGTVWSQNQELAWAAVQDRKLREHLIVQVGDRIRGNAAQVVRIEPKRLVLREKGKLRELALAEPAGAAARRTAAAGPAPKVPPRAGRKRARAARRTQAASPSTAAAVQPGSGSMRAAAKLFSEAQILPKYDEGEMVGVQINAIQPGSTFEKMGFEEGDVITQLNGIEITSPEESAKVLAEFAESSEFTITTLGRDGEEDTREMVLDPDDVPSP